MTASKFIFLLIGLALFFVVLLNTDLSAAYETGIEIGFGFAIVMAIFAIAFSLDVVAWQLAVTSVSVNIKWFYRLFMVRLAGEAFNNITPAASVGGEPVKLVMLKKIYDVEYAEGIASLVIAKTTFIIALILFLIIGFVLILRGGAEIASFKYVSGVGLAVLFAGVGSFFLVQRYGAASRVAEYLSKKNLFRAARKLLHHVQDFDSRLHGFYARQPKRFFWSVIFAFINWILGAVEIYVILSFLGHPISFADAWIIETFTQLMRAASFFIPLSLGIQEGTFFVVILAMTGNPHLGVAVALIRRIRELIWIGLGLIVFYVLKPPIGKLSAE